MLYNPQCSQLSLQGPSPTSACRGQLEDQLTAFGIHLDKVCAHIADITVKTAVQSAYKNHSDMKVQLKAKAALV